MSKEIKYPYIGRLQENITFFTGVDSGFVIENVNEDFLTYSERWGESFFYDITREYLQNTWGVVESKEHAEFIMKLSPDFRARSGFAEGYPCWFCFDEDELYFFDHAHQASSEGDKKIKIPLPPKAKEWMPEVGCDAFTCTDRLVSILAIDGCNAWVRYNETQGHYNTIPLAKLKRPKSAQEPKVEELQTKLCENDAVDNYTLACDIVMGNIEGLNYE